MMKYMRLRAYLFGLIFALVLVGCSSDSADAPSEAIAPTPTAEAVLQADTTAESNLHGGDSDMIPMFVASADGAVEFSLEVFGPPIIDVVTVGQTIELRLIVPRQPSGNSGVVTIAMPATISTGTHEIALVTTDADAPLTLSAQFDSLADDDLFTVVLLESLNSATLTLTDTAPDNFTGEFAIDAQTNNGALEIAGDFEHLPITPGDTDG